MKQLQFTIKDNSIGWLEWDQPNSSVNLISSAFIKELEELIPNIEASKIKALIFISNKENNFCAGADIKEIQQIKETKKIKSILESAHSVFSKFENLKLSKIVAIEGACLGGGLEWALCFDYRLASKSRQTKLGLPEVQLGLIPGLGACIRLPKLIGLRQALKLILTGKSLRAKQAFSIDLVNEHVPALVLKKRALQLAEQIITSQSSSKVKNSYKEKQAYSYWLELFLKPFICFLFKKQTLKKTKGFYPAPLKAIQLIKKTYHSSLFEENIKKESSVFIELLQTKESKNLIYLWSLMDKAKKIKSLSKNNKPIQKTAVIGAGVMGQSIAYLLADKGFKVRLIDNNPSALCQALKLTKKLFEKQKMRKQIDSYEFESKINSLSVSQNFWGFKTFDLIIEALPENLELKQKLIAEISKKLNPDCLFASNTSSLSLSELTTASIRPSHFFGLHFFNPAHRMPLLEVSLTEKQKETLTQVIPFIKQLGKTPLFVKDSPGFVVNRILAVYLSESLNLLEQGWSLHHIDHILKEQFGMPLGPFELMDKIGLDICLQTISQLNKKGCLLKTPDWTKNLKELLGEGEKSKKGFYIYKDKEKIVNPKTNKLKKIKEIKLIDEKQIIQQLIQKMSKEGEKLIQDKIVQNEAEIDLAMVLGAGFPAYLAGPMRYKKSLNS